MARPKHSFGARRDSRSASDTRENFYEDATDDDDDDDYGEVEVDVVRSAWPLAARSASP